MTVVLENNYDVKFPKGWINVPLKEIVDPIKGKKPKNITARESVNTVPYINIQAFEKKIFDQFTTDNDCPKCIDEDILMVWDGAREGLVGTGVSGVIGSTLTKLQHFIIESKYLYYFMQTQYGKLNKNPKGIGIPHVNPDILWNLQFPLSPLNEQKRIVSKIEELFSILEYAILICKKMQLQVLQYKESILEQVFTGKLTKKWREKHYNELEHPLALLNYQKFNNSDKHSCILEDSSLPEIPQEWIWTRIECYALCARGKFSIRPRNDPRYYGGSHPFIQIGDLPKKGGEINTHKQTLNNMGFSVSKKFPKNTVVIAIVGATIANTGILKYDMCFPDSLIGINSDTLIGNRFIEFYLRSQKKNIRSISYSSGGQPNVNLDTINKYHLPLPSLLEQQEIVNNIDESFTESDKMETTIHNTMILLNQLQKAVLNLAFSGKLVPQDPNDESASILLEKIKQEKEKSREMQKINKSKSFKSRRVKNVN